MKNYRKTKGRRKEKKLKNALSQATILKKKTKKLKAFRNIVAIFKINSIGSR